MFTDRKEAGLMLGKALERYKDKDAVVLGIPRGGAVIGYYVATYLNSEFSLLVSRKLGHPENPEYAIGAVAEDGTIYLNDFALTEVSQAHIDYAVAVQKQEIKRRIKILRKGEPLPNLKDRIVILIDDGIATGATIFAAIKMCRKQKAAKIVVAAPVSGLNMATRLRKEADDVVILDMPDYIHAISQDYLSFVQVSDAEATGLLEKWQIEHAAIAKHKIKQEIIDEP